MGKVRDTVEWAGRAARDLATPFDDMGSSSFGGQASGRETKWKGMLSPLTNIENYDLIGKGIEKAKEPGSLLNKVAGVSNRSLASFKAAMIQKYGAVRPMGMAPMMGKQVPNPGIRYTGNAPDSQVAGVVHGGEQVIEAPMVRQAGGPEVIREKVEELAAKPGYRRGTGFSRVKGYGCGTGKKVASYADGTDETVVLKPEDSVNTNLYAQDAATRQANIAQGGTTETFEAARSGITLPTPAPTVTPPAGNKPPSVLPGVDPNSLVSGAAKNLLATSQGQDENFKKLAQISRLNLAGRQSSDMMKVSQGIAQSQKTGGEAAAAQARMGIEQGIERQANETGIMQTDLERRDAATKELAALGLNVASLEQKNKTEERGLTLEESKFKESLKQWTSEFGLDEKQFDDNKAKWMAEFGLDEKQFEEMKTQWKSEFGLKTTVADRDYSLALDQFAWGKEKWGAEFDLTKAQFGLDEKKFEEFKVQWAKEFGLKTDQMNLEIGKFEESKKEFGLDYALREMTSSFTVQNARAEQALALGNFRTAAQLFQEAGVDVTEEDLRSSTFGQQAFGEAIAQVAENLTATTEGQSLYDVTNYGEFVSAYGEGSTVVSQMQDAWKAKTGKEASGPEYESWALNQFKSLRTQSSPYKSAVMMMDDNEIEATLESVYDIPDINDYMYKVGGQMLKGVPAARAALTDVLSSGAASVIQGSDGSTTVTYDPGNTIWRDMDPDLRPDKTGSGALEDTINSGGTVTDEMIKDVTATSTASLPTKDFAVWIKDNTYKGTGWFNVEGHAMRVVGDAGNGWSAFKDASGANWYWKGDTWGKMSGNPGESDRTIIPVRYQPWTVTGSTPSVTPSDQVKPENNPSSGTSGGPRRR